MTPSATCPLCTDDAGHVVWRQPELRIVRVTGADADEFPGFYRVIWHAHVVEWTDLTDSEQARCLRALNATERAVRGQLQPTKVNLASLGNVVPHLHWHVVARFDGDSRFPSPIWAPAQRHTPAERLDAVRARLPACDAAIVRAMSAPPLAVAD